MAAGRWRGPRCTIRGAGRLSGARRPSGDGRTRQGLGVLALGRTIGGGRTLPGGADRYTGRWAPGWARPTCFQVQGDVLLSGRTDRDGALARYQEALTLYRAVGDRLGEANVLKAQGDAALRGGQIDIQAWRFWNERDSYYQLIGARRRSQQCRDPPCTVRSLAGRLGAAAIDLDAAGRRLRRRDRTIPSARSSRRRSTSGAVSSRDRRRESRICGIKGSEASAQAT